MPRAGAVRKPSTDARNRPVRSTRGHVETAEQIVGQDRPRHLRAAGKARQALDPAVVQPVERVVSNEKLEALKFNEDMLIIRVAESTNPTDEPFAQVWNDGRSVVIPRGEDVQVRRKFVEVLARAKKTTYTQEKLPNNEGYRNIPHTALKFDFALINDPNPRGGQPWLRGILSEG